MTETADRLLQRARKAARRGAAAEAARLYREVLARFPANKRAAEGLKRLEFHAGPAPLQREVAGLIDLYRRGDFGAVLARAPALAAQFPQPGLVPNLKVAALGTDRAFVTNKMPDIFRWAEFLMAAMPEARVINLNRDPVAVG